MNQVILTAEEAAELAAWWRQAFDQLSGQEA
jgi:hypothetical protein